jgi:hypothetical protein
VLLEVRTHVEAKSAQLDRVNARLERLDARVATLEKGAGARDATSVGVRYRPAACARAGAPRLLDLPSDVLAKVVEWLDPDDELATSLACRRLRDTRARRPLKTSVRSLLGSLGKLQCGVGCGAPLSKTLIAHVAGLGDLRALSWLRARG